MLLAGTGRPKVFPVTLLLAVWSVPLSSICFWSALVVGDVWTVSDVHPKSTKPTAIAMQAQNLDARIETDFGTVIGVEFSWLIVASRFAAPKSPRESQPIKPSAGADRPSAALYVFRPRSSRQTRRKRARLKNSLQFPCQLACMNSLLFQNRLRFAAEHRSGINTNSRRKNSFGWGIPVVAWGHSARGAVNVS
jgi:hypothetical protein